MQIVTVSPKYQVVIPKKIRDTLRLRPGQKMRVIEYDSTYGILRAQINDPFDLEEYRESLIQITSGVHYSATVPAIWDLRKLNFSDLESKLAYYVKEIRSSFKIRRNAKIAYVVSSQLGYGLMRMLQVVTDTEESSLVCYEYDEAERWIKDVAQSRPQKRS